MRPACSSAYGFLLLLALLPAGCGFGSLPSQQHPTCSWSSEPPPNASSLCSTAFSTLTRVVDAAQAGDDATIHRIVTNRAVAQRIISFGKSQHANGAHGLHVVPSFTLEITDQGLLGAGFYILGKNRGGNVNSPETVYMKVHANRVRIVQDQPNQDW